MPDNVPETGEVVIQAEANLSPGDIMSERICVESSQRRHGGERWNG